MPTLAPYQLAMKLPYLRDSLGNTLLLSSHRDLILAEGQGRDVDPSTSGISNRLRDCIVGTHDEGVELLGDLKTLKCKFCLRVWER